jgi:DNA-nicking Smr family endonuclease
MSGDGEFEKLLDNEKHTDEFASLIEGDIKPLVQDKVAVVSSLIDKKLAKVRQESATHNKEEVKDTASSGFVKMVAPNDVLEFRRPGIQPYVMLKLRNGDYVEADYIDLHGKTIEEAYHAVMRFIDNGRKREYRCLLIIHGKGEKSKPQALMKSHVAHWLKQIDDVLAFHSAPNFKGGTGALYFILKKGDKESQANREKYQKR